MCIFKSLNKDPNKQYEGLDENDFLRFYEVLDFRWTLVSTFKLMKLLSKFIKQNGDIFGLQSEISMYWTRLVIYKGTGV